MEKHIKSYPQDLNALISLIQRVNEASVTVDGEVVGSIGRGILALVAVQPDDTDARAARLAERLTGYRIFPDKNDKMNESLLDQGLELLLVPQFTLAADTKKGMRPSFTRAAPPEMGAEFFERFVEHCRGLTERVACGRFGADMKVALINDGPVTFWIEA